MQCKLVVGQKVVHVPNLGGEINFREICNDVTWPEIGGVYTIDELRLDYRGKVGVILKELSEQCTSKHPEFPGVEVNVLFSYWEFQPLSFLDIDISMFTKMLTPKELVS